MGARAFDMCTAADGFDATTTFRGISTPGEFKSEIARRVAEGRSLRVPGDALDFATCPPDLLLHFLESVDSPESSHAFGSDGPPDKVAGDVEFRTGTKVRLVWAERTYHRIVHAVDPNDAARIVATMMSRSVEGSVDRPLPSTEFVQCMADALEFEIVEAVLCHPRRPVLDDAALARVLAMSDVYPEMRAAFDGIVRGDEEWGGRPHAVGKEVLHQAVCVVDRAVYDMATAARDVEFRPDTLQTALEHLEFANWDFVSVKVPYPREPFEERDRRNLEFMIDDMVRRKCPVSPHTLIVAAGQGHLGALEHAMQGASLRMQTLVAEEAAKMAARRGKLQALKFLAENGAVVVKAALEIAIVRRDTEMVAYILGLDDEPGELPRRPRPEAVAAAIEVRDWNTVRALLARSPRRRPLVCARMLVKAACVDGRLASFIRKRGTRAAGESVGAVLDALGPDSESWPLSSLDTDASILIGETLFPRIPRGDSERLEVPRFPDSAFLPARGSSADE